MVRFGPFSADFWLVLPLVHYLIVDCRQFSLVMSRAAVQPLEQVKKGAFQ
jgi:hypothetical protein